MIAYAVNRSAGTLNKSAEHDHCRFLTCENLVSQSNLEKTRQLTALTAALPACFSMTSCLSRPDVYFRCCWTTSLVGQSLENFLREVNDEDTYIDNNVNESLGKRLLIGTFV